MTVWDLVMDIVHAYPALRAELLDDKVPADSRTDQRSATFRTLKKEINTILKPDDTVNIFPSVGGG